MLENDHDEEREEKGYDQVEQPEDGKCGQNTRRIHFRQAGNEDQFQHTKAAGRMR